MADMVTNREELEAAYRGVKRVAKLWAKASTPKKKRRREQQLSRAIVEQIRTERLMHMPVTRWESMTTRDKLVFLDVSFEEVTAKWNRGTELWLPSSAR